MTAPDIPTASDGLSPTAFVDLHVHLLAGVDDGPADRDESLEMCRLMVAEGVRTATATPHINPHWPANTAASIRQGVAGLRDDLAAHGIALDVRPGADIRVDSDFLKRWRAGELVSVGDHGRAVLLELPDNVLIPLDGLSFELRVRRVMPILTHPERCEPLQRRWSDLVPWVEQGLHLQVTTGSLLGEFGSRARTTAEALIDEGLVTILASDAHGATRRRPNHRAAFELCRQRWGPAVAQRLMITNPAAILAGRLVEPVVPDGRPHDDSPRSGAGSADGSPRGLLSRLFGW